MSRVNVEEKWPVLGRHERAAEWLGIWTNLGRAPRTIDAYARGLAEYLLVCERDGVDPLTANRSQVALFVRELATRPHARRQRGRSGLRGRSVQRHVAAAAGAGAAVLRLPHRGGRARLQPGRPRPLHPWSAVRRRRPAAGAADGQAAVDPGRERVVHGCWTVFRREPIRNRLMLALAYDSALRREELCSLRTDDLDPAHRTLRVRAETTKTRRERIVPYSALDRGAAGELPAPPRHAQPGQGPVVPVGIAAQPRRAADLVDLVEGGAPGRAGRGRAAVLHAHHPASVSDRSGPDGLGTARDRDLRRAPVHRVDAALHPPVRTGSGRPS